MEPQVQYVKTSDGVNIAYYAIGNGPPLLLLDFPSSLLAAWKAQRQFFEFAASVFTLISYDARGCGLSDRDVTDFSIDGMVRDIEAVVERVGVESVRIIAAGGMTAPVSVAFAGRHPDRVSHLVIFWGFAAAPASMHEQVEALLAHPNGDWRFVSESFLRIAHGWDDPDASREQAAHLRESISLEGFKTLEAQAAQWDVTDDLARVTASALVVNPKDHPIIGAGEAAALAVALRDARVVLMEGTSSARRGEEFVAAAMPFLLPGQAIATPAPPALPLDTAVILFADVVDSTAITARIGNAAFRERTRQLDEGIRTVIRRAGGVPVEGRTLGDGVIGTFTSAAQAIAAALRCEEHAEGVGLQLHLGIHAGDVIHESGKVSGIAVSIAARISDITAPNEILVSSTVRDLARASTHVTFEDRGEHSLKGVAEPQRVYAVRANANG
jgi:class 3 adenylate cyclase